MDENIVEPEARSQNNEEQNPSSIIQSSDDLDKIMKEIDPHELQIVDELNAEKESLLDYTQFLQKGCARGFTDVDYNRYCFELESTYEERKIESEELDVELKKVTEENIHMKESLCQQREEYNQIKSNFEQNLQNLHQQLEQAKSKHPTINFELIEKYEKDRLDKDSDISVCKRLEDELSDTLCLIESMRENNNRLRQSCDQEKQKLNASLHKLEQLKKMLDNVEDTHRQVKECVDKDVKTVQLYEMEQQWQQAYRGKALEIADESVVAKIMKSLDRQTKGITENVERTINALKTIKEK